MKESIWLIFFIIYYMKYYSDYLKQLIVICLFIAMLGTGYIFMLTIVFNDKTYLGFFNSWQFPMLFAIYIDTAYHQMLYK